jgi:hypothetical protein
MPNGREKRSERKAILTGLEYAERGISIGSFQYRGKNLEAVERYRVAYGLSYLNAYVSRANGGSRIHRGIGLSNEEVTLLVDGWIERLEAAEDPIQFLHSGSGSRSL